MTVLILPAWSLNSNCYLHGYVNQCGSSSLLLELKYCSKTSICNERFFHAATNL